MVSRSGDGYGIFETPMSTSGAGDSGSAMTFPMILSGNSIFTLLNLNIGQNPKSDGSNGVFAVLLAVIDLEDKARKAVVLTSRREGTRVKQSRSGT